MKLWVAIAVWSVAMCGNEQTLTADAKTVARVVADAKAREAQVTEATSVRARAIAPTDRRVSQPPKETS